MIPESFPEVNVVWAKDQVEYGELPSYTDARDTVTCWRFSAWERLIVLFKGVIWLRQRNYGKPLQPQRPTVYRPFVEDAPLVRVIPKESRKA